MSGHNKWKQIKHQKAATDSKRSKVFSILSKQITIAAKAAAGDNNSPILRAAVEKARKQNMPNDNIERAIKKATGEGAESFEEVLFEAYGPGGLAIIIEGITGSKNKTSQEIKHLLSENGGSLSAPGSVTWAFEKMRDDEGNLSWQPKSTVPLSESDTEALAKLIEKLEDHDDVREVYTNAE